MSNEYRHVELLSGDVRRRRWTTEQKLTIIEQSFEPGETVSSAARCQVTENLVEHAKLSPTAEAVAKSLVRPVVLRCIFPLEAVLQHIDEA